MARRMGYHGGSPAFCSALGGLVGFSNSQHKRSKSGGQEYRVVHVTVPVCYRSAATDIFLSFDDAQHQRKADPSHKDVGLDHDREIYCPV